MTNEGGKCTRVTSTECLSEILQNNTSVWVDIQMPDCSDIQTVARMLSLHTLTINDMVSTDTVAKVDVFAHYMFIALHVPTTEQFCSSLLFVLVTGNSIWTLHLKPIPSLNSMLAQLDVPLDLSFSNVVLNNIAKNMMQECLQLMEQLTEQSRIIDELSTTLTQRQSRFFLNKLMKSTIQNL